MAAYWDFYRVSCHDEDCCGYACGENTSTDCTWYGSIEEAREAWNRRHESTCTWEATKGGCVYAVYTCSNCGYEYAESRCDNGIRNEICDANYCPNCGAKVRR